MSRQVGVSRARGGPRASLSGAPPRSRDPAGARSRAPRNGMEWLSGCCDAFWRVFTRVPESVLGFDPGAGRWVQVRVLHCVLGSSWYFGRV